MQKWYVKEFSKLTKVTVRTLHHYDQIGLLKPSLRFPNGYRVYSEADLMKLQQIIALRFFGFSLSAIKDIMKKNVNVIEHLKVQCEYMQNQILHLQESSQILNSIIDDIIHNKELNYSPEHLRHFSQLQKSYVKREIADYKKRWEMLLAEIQSNIDEKPTGPVGKRLARRWTSFLNELENKDPEFKAALALPKESKNSSGESPSDEQSLTQSVNQEILTWIERALE